MTKTKDTRQKMKNLMEEFFVNAPESTEHGLKLIESKIRHHVDFKNF